MNRKEITVFLRELLIYRLSGKGKYWASEVSLDYGTRGVKRVDFMQFEPAGVVHISEIEKGTFTSYEVKSCKSDYESGYGRNFETEKNYFVMPMSLYKELAVDIDSYVGVMCPVPANRDMTEEFDSPTALNEKGIAWELKVIKPAHKAYRKRSMTELLFCMLRAGH